MDPLKQIENLLSDQPAQPPIERWQPELSGDIDIVIRRDGSWYHEGDLMQRHALVKLFASILRREADGEYYLVTPVEKWRLQVEDLPLQVVDMEVEASGAEQVLAFKTNTDRWYRLGTEHPLDVATDAQTEEPAPSLQLDHGLAGRVVRSVFYRLVELAVEEAGELVVYSAGERYSLGRI